MALSDGPDSSLNTQIISRIGLFSAGVFLLLAAEVAKLSRAMRELDEVVVAEMFCYLFAFGLFALAAVGRVNLRQAGLLALIATFYGLGLAYYANIEQTEGSYLFDILPVTHRSAELIVDGVNPYSIRDNQEFVLETAARFDSPLFLFTQTEDGEIFDTLLQYPPGQVLPFVPAVLAGLDDMRWITSGAMLAVIGLVWYVAPVSARPLATVPFLANPEVTILGPILGGVMDQMWLLPLMVMAYALYNGRLGWAAVAYGIAASMRQASWLLVPFLLIWLWRRLPPDSSRPKEMAKLAGTAFAFFMVVNLPFIIWGPSDWLNGITYAVTTDLDSIGTGLTDIRFIGLDVDRGFFTVTAITCLALLLVLYARFFDTLEHVVWLLPAVVIWFAPRPLYYYFLPWVMLLLFVIMLRLRQDDASEGVGTMEREGVLQA